MRPSASFVVAIMLFVLGGLFALYESYEKIREALGERDYDPFASRWWWVPLAVLVVAMVLGGYRACAPRSARTSRPPGRSWLHFVRSTKSPELPVVLLEDFAALIGLVLALAGVGLTLVTANPVWDGLGSGAIGLLLVGVAAFLAVEMSSLLVGEAASLPTRRRILEALESARGHRPRHQQPHDAPGPGRGARRRQARGGGHRQRRRGHRRPSTRPSGPPGRPPPELRLVIYLEPDLDTSPGAASVDGPGANADPLESAVEDASRG